MFGCLHFTFIDNKHSYIWHKSKYYKTNFCYVKISYGNMVDLLHHPSLLVTIFVRVLLLFQMTLISPYTHILIPWTSLPPTPKIAQRLFLHMLIWSLKIT